MNILWIFHLILKCINVHLTLSPCLSVLYSELVKQVVAGMLGSIMLPLIFKYSVSLGLQIKASLWTLTYFQCLTSRGMLIFLHCLPLCVSTLASFACSLKHSCPFEAIVSLIPRTCIKPVINYTVRRLNLKHKIPMLGDCNKASDYAKILNQIMHRPGL